MLRRQCGYTVIELLTVMAVLGVVATIVTTALAPAFTANARRSARREATAYVFRAKAIAIQQSRTAYLIHTGNALKILVDSSGTKVQIGVPLDVGTAFNATLTATPSDTIKFDPRGFVTIGGSTPRLIVTMASSTGADTICVTGLGRVTTSSCS